MSKPYCCYEKHDIKGLGRSYANYTKDGWNLRFRANVYKQPNTTQEKLDDLADKFLIGTSVKDLPESQKAQARNVTAGIFVIQQGDVKPVFTLAPTPTAGGAQVSQVVYFPTNTQ